MWCGKYESVEALHQDASECAWLLCKWAFVYFRTGKSLKDPPHKDMRLGKPCYRCGGKHSATSRMSCVTSVTRKDIANVCVRAVFVSATHHLRQLTQRRANNLVHYLACFWVDVCESRSVYCRGWRPIACVYLLTKVHRKL